MCVSIEIFWFKNLEFHTFQYVYLYLHNFRIVVANSLYVSHELGFFFYVILINHFSMLYVSYWDSWDIECNLKFVNKYSLEYVNVPCRLLKLTYKMSMG